MDRIIMLDLMKKQIKDKRVMAADVLKRVIGELETLISEPVLNSIQSYLISHNGKKLKGTENIWKYRLSDGDRILYTYGRYLPYIKEAESGTIVLLGYAKHDDQGFFGKYHDFVKEKDYTDVAKYVKEWHESSKELTGAASIEEIMPEDLYVIADILSSTYFSREHTAYVVSEEMIANATTEELDENPLLSEAQAKCVDDFGRTPKPTLILGGAGTGKTLIGVHILNNFMTANEGSENAAYFTQSEELRRSVEHKYRIVSGKDETSEMFFNINNFCINKLGISEKQSDLMTLSKFERDVFAKLPYPLLTKCERSGIDYLSAWTEIRGIIKGQLDHNWRRYAAIPQNKIPGSSNISHLVKIGIFDRTEKDKTKILIPDLDKALSAMHSNSTLITDEEKRTLEYVIKYFSSVDTNLEDIGENVYYALSYENSTLSEEKRKIVWEVYEIYKNYIRQNQMFDDNDLARMTISKFRDHVNKEGFELIVVDEVQDYTELQIYLLHSLSNNGKQIIYAGDANQNVNPTLFQEEKLQRLYRKNNDATELNTIFLTSNYRCPKQTVKVTNELSKLRRKIVARGKVEREIDETSGREGTTPLRLKYSEQNVKRLLLEIMKYPRVAFLVPDEMSKQEIIQLIGEDVYINNGVPFIHTVSEIKGMEYAYVVCFDLFGKFIDIWNTMLSKEHKKKNTGERYYFNLPYVAMTRTQQHLCIIDKNENHILNERLNIHVLSDFDPDEMNLRALDSGVDAWISAARECEKNGLYRDAFDNYIKAGASYKDIRRCEAKVFEDIGDYSNAIRCALIARDKGSAIEYSKQLDHSDDARKLIEAIILNDREPNIKVEELVGRIYCKEDGNYTDEEIMEVRLFCIQQIDELLNRYLDQSEDWLNDIEELVGEAS